MRSSDGAGEGKQWDSDGLLMLRSKSVMSAAGELARRSGIRCRSMFGTDGKARSYECATARL